MKPEDIKEAIEFSNFCQFFKMEIWKRTEGRILPEDELDELAKLLFDYLK